MFLYVFFFFSSREGAWAWLKTHINHTTPLGKTSTKSTPYTRTQSSINAHTTKKSCQHPHTPQSPKRPGTYLILILKLSTVSAATTFLGRPFHALTTL